MPAYEIALTISVVLFAALALMRELMRRQVNHAHYGNQDIGPWDVRFTNEFLGNDGIWAQHKRAYERSPLRRAFMITCAVLALSVLVGLSAFVNLWYSR